MKQAIIYIAALMLFACSKADAPIDNNKGGIKINVNFDKSFANAATKAIVEDTYPISTTQLSLAIKVGDSVVYSWDKVSDVPEIIFLNAGDYNLVVQTNGVRGAVNAVPLYYGESNFSIVAGQTSSVYANAKISTMSASVVLAGDIAPLTGYTMKYFDILNPDVILFTITQATNTATAAASRVYMDKAFNFGVKIEGRLNGLKWAKNVIVTENIALGTYHNITVK